VVYQGDDVKRFLLWVLVVCVIVPIVTLSAFLTWMSFAINWKPPEMFSQQFAPGSRFDRSETAAAVTEILNKRFPSGSRVSDLRSALSEEGFRDVPPPPSNCVPSGTEVPVRRVYTPCYDHRNQMEYSWSMGLVCGGHIYVKWTMDEAGNVVRVEGHDASACL
jgi:hypothetical protein